MASRCCCSVDRSRLLGQLILATVATQAALNSVAAFGVVGGAGGVGVGTGAGVGVGVGVGAGAGFEAAQAFNKTINKQAAKNSNDLLTIGCVFRMH